MFSINRKHKKQYIAPVIEFEMMEEEVRVMAGSPKDWGQSGGASEGGNKGNDQAKRSDFIFDDGFDSEPVENTSDGELPW